MAGIDMNKFTTDFQRQVYIVVASNELGRPRDASIAYKLSPPADNKASGYAYGWIQFDLHQKSLKPNIPINKTIIEIVNDAIDNIDGDVLKGQVTNIEGWKGKTEQEIREGLKKNLLKTVGKEDNLVKACRDLITAELKTSQLSSRIDAATVTSIQDLESHVQNVIAQVTDPTRRTFLEQSDAAKLFLADVKNQFGDKTNKALVDFLNGNNVTPPYGGVPVQIKGELGLEDLIRFHLSTAWAQEPGNAAKLIRRFSNILERVGIDNIPLTQEDAQFLVEVLPGLLGKDAYRALWEDADNWGIRNLILKACSDWYSGFYIDMHMYNRGVTLEEVEKYFKTAEVTLSPIVFDLDGDGIETIALTGGAYFDHDGNGFSEQTGWVNRDDGLLVMDRDGNGFIDSGKELFGNQTLLANGTKAANGFQALAQLDSNHDGRIDANDAVYSQLMVWQDLDGDGAVSYYVDDEIGQRMTNELITLDELGIQSIGTGYANTNTTDVNGNVIKQAGTFTNTDGTTGSAADVYFQVDKMHTVANEWLDVPPDIAALPDLRGFGNVHDLHQAMVRDASGHLQGLIEQFASETDPAARRALVTTILYAWAGVENVDPLSRAARMIYGNAIGDARKLATLEAFTGEGYFGTWCWNEHDPNPHGPQTHFFVDKSFLSPILSVLQP